MLYEEIPIRADFPASLQPEEEEERERERDIISIVVVVVGL